jgi:Holliday junction resolvasome RuvABC ATP-dependent DNA helicase subunit
MTHLADMPATQVPRNMNLNINNCPASSRTFHGQRIILEKMHQYFTQGSSNQHIFLLHGLGGAGKTQIGLKFIEESVS